MSFNVGHVFFSKLVKVIGFRDFFFGGGEGGGWWWGGADDVIVPDRFSSENFSISGPGYNFITKVKVNW